MRLLPLLAALPVVVAYGLAEGVWAGRWHHSEDLQRAAARLDDVPMRIGDWQGEARELDPQQKRVAEVEGDLLRRYTHDKTHESVTVLIVCGRPGPVSVHPPTVCYDAAGYAVKGQPARAAVEGRPAGRSAEFWRATFEKSEAGLPDQLLIRWAWSADGTWTAADRPRLQFARAAALYKLYVIRQVRPGEADGDKDPAAEFLPPLLSELQKALFPDRDS